MLDKKIHFNTFWDTSQQQRRLTQLGHNGLFVFARDYPEFNKINHFALRQQREFMEAKWHEKYKEI